MRGLHETFFGQTVPNTGIVENGVVSQHVGFLPPGSGGILDDPMFENADFTAPGYQVARITITRVPEPGALLLLGAGASWRACASFVGEESADG